MLGLFLLTVVAGVWYLTRPRDAAPELVRSPFDRTAPAPVAATPPAAPPAAPSPSLPTPPADTLPATTVATAQPSNATVTPTAAPATTAAPVAASAPAQLTPEEQATSRMIEAHAPLRVPAVADPDSKENRVVLQTMLHKALIRKEAPPK